MRFSCASLGPLNAKKTPPNARKTRTLNMMIVIADSSWLRCVERVGEFVLEAEIARAIPEGGTRDAGADMPPADLAGFVLAFDLEDDEVLRDDDVALAADHFGDVRDAA